ncbi:hypothetical protein, unlikely [Trypanosoma brucei gambiense DAL972]|uniref:Uncharacterized protein n=1 Tax=Trypanosoma brucei gambiense (strain MHOM/CI/86/DAL972) TaxID=679716 RepID=C9ZLK5_TRYB9|nr:hypothetical protein, unlikely [Trypanosoma brucei gambiense DAL972]CBH10214.1 hypothetical protein, unlikely [Trypanosoma brucei gambiense DAL972]|eukprot:XP_011772504.1 hypothetical protein, unlikely [Trypanosoma brucei gambiense DAL972]
MIVLPFPPFLSFFIVLSLFLSPFLVPLFVVFVNSLVPFVYFTFPIHSSTLPCLSSIITARTFIRWQMICDGREPLSFGVGRLLFMMCLFVYTTNVEGDSQRWRPLF